jgi:rhomboid protease GluP
MGTASTVAPLVFTGVIIAAVTLFTCAGSAHARRRDYRRILADGRQSSGTVLSVGAADRSGRCRLQIEFPAGDSGRTVRITQRTTADAIRRRMLMVGSSIAIHYLPKSPKAAFAPSLVIEEQQPTRRALLNDDAGEVPVYFVAFTSPAQHTMTVQRFSNSFRWFGPGLVRITDRELRVVTRRARWFRTTKEVTSDINLKQVVNVEAHGNIVRLELLTEGGTTKNVTLWTVDSTQAAAIGAALPTVKTPSFAATLAEASEFRERLTGLTPITFVTTALIVINVVAFIASLALGAGVFAQHPEVLVRLGSNFTSLTRGGEWWRLLTNTFLHFGILHITFNMWALALNGPLAERLYGSTRYLVIYLLAGLAGSAASLWWHPVVNGAGASGAIFGVFGALLAFFLRRHSGVPLSVIKAHRTSIAVFIAYALLNGARVKGIDNAAHLGGLAAGLALGLVLGRPIDVERDIVRERRLAVALVLAVYVGIAIALVLAPPHPLPQEPSNTSASTVRQPTNPTAAAAIDDVPRNRAPANRLKLAKAKFITEFAGVRLGETRAEVERSKGRALKVEGHTWLYNSRGPGDNGLVEVSFGRAATDAVDVVVSVSYQGDIASAPPGLTYVITATEASLVEEFHEPVWRVSPRPGEDYAMFEDGETVHFWHGRASSYGIQSYYRMDGR